MRYFPERDLQKRYTNEQYRDQFISEVVILFQHILDFNKVSFADPILEMRNPYMIKCHLRVIITPIKTATKGPSTQGMRLKRF